MPMMVLSSMPIYIKVQSRPQGVCATQKNTVLPIDNNKTTEGRANNRRVEFVKF